MILSFDRPDDPVVAATGLVYRARPAATHAPLVVMVHGLGGDERVMWIFEPAIPRIFTVLSPRAPIQIDAGMRFPEVVERGYSWLPPDIHLDPPPTSIRLAADRLRHFIAAAAQKYEVDRGYIYLMGFSQGAALSYVLSLIAPEDIAGVIALAGFLPSTPSLPHPTEPARYPRDGYLIVHGTDDQTVPLLRAHQARDRLRALGAPVEYHAYPIGHKVAPPGMKDIAKWLASTQPSITGARET
jgi:phospholipase/carboxylesterase